VPLVATAIDRLKVGVSLFRCHVTPPLAGTHTGLYPSEFDVHPNDRWLGYLIRRIAGHPSQVFGWCFTITPWATMGGFGTYSDLYLLLTE